MTTLRLGSVLASWYGLGFDRSADGSLTGSTPFGKGFLKITCYRNQHFECVHALHAPSDFGRPALACMSCTLNPQKAACMPCTHRRISAGPLWRACLARSTRRKPRACLARKGSFGDVHAYALLVLFRLETLKSKAKAGHLRAAIPAAARPFRRPRRTWSISVHETGVQMGRFPRGLRQAHSWAFRGPSHVLNQIEARSRPGAASPGRGASGDENRHSVPGGGDDCAEMVYLVQ